METSGYADGNRAHLLSGLIDSSDKTRCFKFSYHMYGSTIGQLNVYYVRSGASKLVWSLKRNQGDGWQNGRVPITTDYSNFKVLTLTDLFSFKDIQKVIGFIKNFFSKYRQIGRLLEIYSHWPNKSLVGNLIHLVVSFTWINCSLCSDLCYSTERLKKLKRVKGEEKKRETHKKQNVIETLPSCALN